MRNNKSYNPTIDRDKLCICGLKYIDHFYFKRGSTKWFWAWFYDNKCEGFLETKERA